MLEAFFVSTVVVALAEMGDRTQLLAVVLASRFRKPIPILLGILIATLASNVLAAVVGFYMSSLLTATWFRYAVSISFIAMAVWSLLPETADEGEAKVRPRLGVFVVTLVSFFLVEMGDKTQIVAIQLAAQFHDIPVIVAGTTTGMMLANIPAVLLGERATRVLPLGLFKAAAAILYLGLGLWGLAVTAGWIRS